MAKPELFGLVLAGGQSQRMGPGQDKSQMIYPEISLLPQRLRLLQALESCGLRSYISCRPNQLTETDTPQKIILDRSELVGGPGVGLLSAHLQFPQAAWLVVACDFPWLGEKQINDLISARTGKCVSVATQHAEQILEPLFAIWEPETLKFFFDEFQKGFKSPQRVLLLSKCTVAEVQNKNSLININTVAEVEAHQELRNRTTKKLIK